MKIDDNFIELKGYKIGGGRNFSNNEFSNAINVCLLGVDVIDQLFEKGSPINQEILVNGIKFCIKKEVKQ
jgi:putative ABC transport system permease protein